MHFADREDAGRQLAPLLVKYAAEGPLVLGLPRGGVPVAFEVAQALGAPLDVWCVRKVGAPDFPELGMGAVAEGGAVFIDAECVAQVGASSAEVDQLVRQKTAEVEERAALFREGQPPPRVRGRTVIVVDDGIATGGTARAAIDALRAAGATRLVLAVPVAATQSIEQLNPWVDELVCVHATPSLRAIGAWYDDFSQVPDEEVIRLLRMARTGAAHVAADNPGPRRAAPAMDPVDVLVPAGAAQLEGTLTLPDNPLGLVLFAHGSGSSRLSPRNRHVAAELNSRRLATLLFDLLTAEEEAEDAAGAELRFDVELLANRLVDATKWARRTDQTLRLPLGYFGASTGAAAALVAAARLPGEVAAVVSRGGRPDLAGASLAQVRAPTLLIVGGEDREVLELNRAAAAKLTGAPAELAVIPRATHLFEEPGALDAVARLAAGWFERHLDARPVVARTGAAQARPARGTLAR